MRECTCKLIRPNGDRHRHSKVGKVVAICIVAIGIVVLLLEVLVRAELTEESEENVQRLDYWFLILQLVHWNITHCTDDFSVVRDMHVDFGAGEGRRLESLFHFRRPLLH